MSWTHYLPLAGILIVVLGFWLKLNPMLVVTGSAIVTGLVAGMGPVEVVSTFGKAFNDNRIIAIVWIVLPVVGLLERYGLKERAAATIRRIKAATAGHAQTVNPIVAPMALVAAEREHGALDDETTQRVKAMTAATDNVGLFFGEDIFFAIGSIVLIQATLATYGFDLTPLQLAVWAIPTAIAAFLIHGARLLLLDRSLRKPKP
jgi:uncharacterized membrane protein